MVTNAFLAASTSVPQPYLPQPPRHLTVRAGDLSWGPPGGTSWRVVSSLTSLGPPARTWRGRSSLDLEAGGRRQFWSEGLKRPEAPDTQTSLQESREFLSSCCTGLKPVFLTCFYPSLCQPPERAANVCCCFSATGSCVSGEVRARVGSHSHATGE